MMLPQAPTAPPRRRRPARTRVQEALFSGMDDKLQRRSARSSSTRA